MLLPGKGLQRGFWGTLRGELCSGGQQLLPFLPSINKKNPRDTNTFPLGVPSPLTRASYRLCRLKEGWPGQEAP